MINSGLPWHVNANGYMIRSDISGTTVADCRYKNGIADAQLIVTAVNNHHKLVSILEKIIKQSDEYRELHDMPRAKGPEKLYQEAKSIIAGIKEVS